jgi:hypothetical protein
MKRVHRSWRGVALRAPLALLVACAVLDAAPGSPGPSESRAHVRLVRLLSEVPGSEREVLGPVHDLRLRVEHGNILLLRKRGDFAALLPIEVIRGTADSLRYFYYVEHPRFLWLFPGQRDKGIAVAPDGVPLVFNAFELKWRSEAGGLGWIYFPDNEANRNMTFSVVSGRTVDDADPKDTKYWIELGPAGASGF